MIHVYIVELPHCCNVSAVEENCKNTNRTNRYLHPVVTNDAGCLNMFVCMYVNAYKIILYENSNKMFDTLLSFLTCFVIMRTIVGSKAYTIYLHTYIYIVSYVFR